MSNKIQEFLSDNFGSVRVITKDGVIWFVAKDVCDILGVKNTSLAINGNPSRQNDKGVGAKNRGIYNVNTLGGNQDVLCISEQGLYKLIFKSRKPFAEELQDWFCDEVIPSIRKTGGYVETNREEEFVNNTFNVDDETKDKLIEQLKEKNQELEHRNSELEPKANSWDMFCSMESDYTFTETCEIISTRAKEENVNVNICVNKLTALLRDKGVLSKRKINQCYYNLPRIRYRELFNVVPVDFAHGEVTTQTRVKGKGIELIYEVVSSNLDEIGI